MWLPVSTIAAICMILEIADAAHPDNELDMVFKDRTRSEWENVWHKEKYRRCRDTLIRHLYWACEKDIYRITRRTQASEHGLEEAHKFPWITEEKAKRLLRFRRGTTRRTGSSITNECCSSTGCTWEEYAEYCPTNKRYTSYV